MTVLLAYPQMQSDDSLSGDAVHKIPRFGDFGIHQARQFAQHKLVSAAPGAPARCPPWWCPVLGRRRPGCRRASHRRAH